jgi:hypothetical protein
MQPLRIAKIQLEVPLPSPYVLLDGATSRLYTFIQTVTIEDVDSECSSFSIHPATLPFGLLQSIELSAVDSANAGNYSVLLSKETGQRQSDWVPLGKPVFVVGSVLGADDDARHADVDAIRKTTGHDLRFRMIAGSSVANISILLQGPAPSSLLLKFHGANAVPFTAGLTPEEVAAAVAARSRVPFQLPPILPKTRLQGAVKKMRDAEEK